MDLVLAQLPLLLFTAIVPMAAGAFVGLSNAFLTVDFTPDALRRIDRWTLLPLVILAVGLAAGLAFFVSPQMSLLGVQGIDAGALTFVGALSVVFALAAVVYWIAAMMGVLSYPLRKAIAAFMSVLAIAYAVSMGIAYLTSAVSTWASIIVPVGFAGFCIVGGRAARDARYCSCGCASRNQRHALCVVHAVRGVHWCVGCYCGGVGAAAECPSHGGRSLYGC